MPSKPFLEPQRRKTGKRVKWNDDNLEMIKFFKLSDLPVTDGLKMHEVEEIQKNQGF